MYTLMSMYIKMRLEISDVQDEYEMTKLTRTCRSVFPSGPHVDDRSSVIVKSVQYAGKSHEAAGQLVSWSQNGSTCIFPVSLSILTCNDSSLSLVIWLDSRGVPLLEE